MDKHNAKIRLHILSIKALTKETFDDCRGNYAVINCAEQTNKYLSACTIPFMLRLEFADTTNGTDLKAFSEEDGAKIKSFLEALPDSVPDLFIFCDAGESRSTAIAAGILLATGRNDNVIWDNPYYHPNMLVFGRLCNAFGIEMTDEMIEQRRLQSENAFKNAVKNGTFFERWEVIG